jgi:GNAT superfamily N-acetyltransferase
MASMPGDCVSQCALVALRCRAVSQLLIRLVRYCSAGTEHAVVFNAIADDESETLLGSILSFPCLPTSPDQRVDMYCLHKVMVHRRYRGLKIGAALMKAVLDETDRLRADCFLTVNPVNEPAIRLYRSWYITWCSAAAAAALLLLRAPG